jgi:hypothetical protein
LVHLQPDLVLNFKWAHKLLAELFGRPCCNEVLGGQPHLIPNQELVGF